MTLLDPTSAIIAGALGLPALLVLYFLKLRRRPVRVSSTMLWSSSVRDVQVNAPFRWLRASLLLLLHLAILASLVLALGRPALRSDAIGARRVVVLIDRSASMSARDGVDPDGPDAPGATPPSGGNSGGDSAGDSDVGAQAWTRLDEAHARARDVIDRATGPGSSSRVAIIAFGAEARVVQGFTSSRSLLRDALQAITPTDQPADFSGALRLLAGITGVAEDEGDSLDPPLIVLVSDGSLPAPDGDLALRGDLRLVRVGGRSALLAPGAPPPSASTSSAPASTPAAPDAAPTTAAPAAPPALAPPDNVGIVALAARRDDADPDLVRVFARVQSTNPAPVALGLTLFVDGARVDARALDVPAAPAPQPGDADAFAPLDQRPPVGETGVTFEVVAPRGGVFTIAHGRPDALPADDGASLVLGPSALPRIMLVQPAPGATDASPRVAPWLLEETLRQLPTREVRTVRPTEYEFLSAAGAQSAAAGFDLIIFDGVTPSALPPAPSVSFGAGLPVAGLRQTPAPTEPRAPDAAATTPDASAAPDANASQDSSPTEVLNWDRAHPALRDAPLDSLLVAAPLRFPGEAPAPGWTIDELARGRDGPLVLQGVSPAGRTHLVVAFDLERSNWATQVSFPIFLAAAADLLTRREERASGLVFSTGQASWVRLPAGAGATLEGPVTLRVEPARRAPATAPGAGASAAEFASNDDDAFDPGAGVRTPVGYVERAGVYVVRPDVAPGIDAPPATPGADIDRALSAALLDPLESALGVRDALRVAGRAFEPGVRASAPREIWPLLVLIACVLLTLEWLVYAARARA